MKPIQTRYAGCLFRSRLEARWAVLFNAANIPWRYEPEGYELDDDTFYLPDFFLPFHDTEHYAEGNPQEPGVWVELKPTQPTHEEMRRAKLLSEQTHHVTFVVVGTPGNHGFIKYKEGNFVLSEMPDHYFLPYILHHCREEEVDPFSPALEREQNRIIEVARSARFDYKSPEPIRRIA
jgi:hypothetical protein